MSYSFSTELIIVLENLIKDFLNLCSLFNDKLSLSIKFHYLIHYPRMIRLFGPPRSFSTINFESLHSTLKEKIRNSKNWKSVCYTIANKYARSNIFPNEAKIQAFKERAIFKPSHDFINFIEGQKFFLIENLKFGNLHFKINAHFVLFEINYICI